jgi:hypothetical protein
MTRSKGRAYLHGGGHERQLRVASLLCRRIGLMAMDISQQVRLALQEVGVGELPRVRIDLTEPLRDTTPCNTVPSVVSGGASRWWQHWGTRLSKTPPSRAKDQAYAHGRQGKQNPRGGEEPT